MSCFAKKERKKNIDYRPLSYTSPIKLFNSISSSRGQSWRMEDWSDDLCHSSSVFGGDRRNSDPLARHFVLAMSSALIAEYR